MTRKEYLQIVELELSNILKDSKFTNNRNQLSAWKLSADFKRSYDESYLWNRALFLSTNGCQLLLHGDSVRLALSSLKESALIYENLFSISEKYDKEYCLILSSLCYDLAGYQANAVCLIKKLEGYSFTSNDKLLNLDGDNYILTQLVYILIKNIPKANNSINRQMDDDLGLFLFNNAIEKWYSQILSGLDNDFLDEIEKAYLYYLEVRNIPISQLLLLLKTRINIYKERSIWQNLAKIDHIKDNDTWKKYIKLLSGDIYDGYRIKNIDKRLSKFEFWTSQLRAIQKGMLEKEESFVVQMPTSAGKTFIAELSILDSLIKNPGEKCLYISPFRALTNEKEGELSDNLSKLGYSVSALSGNYEIDEYQDLVLSETDVLIATPEKIDLLLRINPDFFNGLSLVVVDEGHILGDISSRSSLLEFLIIRLKIKIANLKILFISAVMPPENANEYAFWLSDSRENVIRSLLHNDSEVTDEWEPTRKLIGSFTWEGINGRVSYLDLQTEDETTNAVTKSFIPSLIKKRQYANTYPDGINKAQTSAALAFRFAQDGNTLIYCAQVADTERVGLALTNLIKKLIEVNEQLPSWANLNFNRESYYYARKWYGENSYITICLSYGIGIHFGDLPESVRRSVETDFANGNLKILIATSTIAQGLNFPIKNLIIHSTIINGSPKSYAQLEVRDFWNIVGRAGRAGMETEGQIIFNIKSWTDTQQFNYYTNKANLTPANSIFFNVLRALITGRIPQVTYDKNIRILAEPYILNLITEESLGTDDEDIINSILGNSLFHIQCIDKKIDIEPLKNSFRRIFSTIKDESTFEQIKVYGETGLNLISNQTIENFVDENIVQITDLINTDNYQNFLLLVFNLFDQGKIAEIQSEKFDKIDSTFTNFFNVTLLWINGAEIDELQQEWQNITPNLNHLNLLISEGFYFRFPWLISSFISIILFKLNADRDYLPTNISNLISYIKYGLNNPRACLLRSLGIKNRDIALVLDSYSNGLEGKELIRFIANLNDQDLENLELSQYDKQNILNVAIKLTPQKYNTIPNEFQFWVKGITYSDNQKFLSTVLSVGDKLSYRRDLTNLFDPFAIEIGAYDGRLGYVPREFAKVLSVEIDINQSTYEITVVNRLEQGDYDDILVKMEYSI